MTEEELRNEYTKLQEKVKAYETEIENYKVQTETYKSDLETRNNEIQKLKENNLDLFLRVQNQVNAPAEQKQETEIENSININDVINTLI